MSEDALLPHDGDWPRGAFGGALVVGLGAVVASAVLIVSVASPLQGLGLALLFLAVATVQAAAYVDALRPWLAGAGVPWRTRVLEPAVLVLVALAFTRGPASGAAALCGLLAGLGLPTAAAIRQRRFGRDLVPGVATGHLSDEDFWPPGPATTPQAPAASASAPLSGPTGAASGPTGAGSGPSAASGSRPGRPSYSEEAAGTPRVGDVLGEALRLEQLRWSAWAAAAACAVPACVAVDATAALVTTLAVTSVALVVVGRRALTAGLAVRDFAGAKTAPRRAFVVLLHDPNPRATGPLLAVWDAEPQPVEGRLPRPETVLRCDERYAALLSAQGGIVVHEAWVDTGPRATSLPRWVVADDGVALPRRRAVRGRAYVVGAIGAEKPARARLLSMRAPHPTTEEEAAADGRVISETAPAAGRWAVLFAWRLATLVLVAVVAATVAARL